MNKELDEILEELNIRVEALNLDLNFNERDRAALREQAVTQAKSDILLWHDREKRKGHKCPWNKATTCYQDYECNGCETYAEAEMPLWRKWARECPTAEEIHKFYLEAVQQANVGKSDYNPQAEKPYEELTEGQKFIDKYIADKIRARLERG